MNIFKNPRVHTFLFLALAFAAAVLGTYWAPVGERLKFSLVEVFFTLNTFGWFVAAICNVCIWFSEDAPEGGMR